jgi:hypothetical protein
MRNLPRLMMQMLFTTVLVLVVALTAPAQDASQNSSDESWTATRQTTVANANPSRTTESHNKSGNRTVDKQRAEVLGPNGR